MTLEFTNIWIDHNDSLFIDSENDTLQWRYHGEWEPVGLWKSLTVDTQIPMHIKITRDSTTLYDADWAIWNPVPPYGVPAWSPVLNLGINIPHGLDVTSVDSSFTGRGTAYLKDYTLGDRFMELYFYDGAGGAASYTATIKIGYTTPQVPEPSMITMLGLVGLLGVYAVRRRLS